MKRVFVFTPSQVRDFRSAGTDTLLDLAIREPARHRENVIEEPCSVEAVEA